MLIIPYREGAIMTRVQALQLLGVKVGASSDQITDAYHKLHPGAERAEADGHPERLRRLDEAYRTLMAEADAGLKGDEDVRPTRGVDAAAKKREEARIKMNQSGGMIWVLVLIVVVAFLAGWYLGLIPGLPAMLEKK